MPRSRGGAPSRPSAPSRPTVPAPPQRSVAPQQQTRPMSTQAPTQQHPQAPAQASQGPGLFGQMASTAAGVAVGSSIGHAIGGFFGGGSSSSQAAPEQYTQPGAATDNYTQPGQAMDSGIYSSSNSAASQQATGPCATDVRNFGRCMDENKGDLNICGWYLEQLRACQAAARNY